jgi:hypothetical protein
MRPRSRFRSLTNISIAFVSLSDPRERFSNLAIGWNCFFGLRSIRFTVFDLARRTVISFDRMFSGSRLVETLNR